MLKQWVFKGQSNSSAQNVFEAPISESTETKALEMGPTICVLPSPLVDGVHANV